MHDYSNQQCVKSDAWKLLRVQRHNAASRVQSTELHLRVSSLGFFNLGFRV